jgi:hypothetical protein
MTAVHGLRWNTAAVGLAGEERNAPAVAGTARGDEEVVARPDAARAVRATVCDAGDGAAVPRLAPVAGKADVQVDALCAFLASVAEVPQL